MVWQALSISIITVTGLCDSAPSVPPRLSRKNKTASHSAHCPPVAVTDRKNNPLAGEWARHANVSFLNHVAAMSTNETHPRVLLKQLFGRRGDARGLSMPAASWTDHSTPYCVNTHTLHFFWFLTRGIYSKQACGNATKCPVLLSETRDGPSC